jgi:hypothetical protein
MVEADPFADCSDYSPYSEHFDDPSDEESISKSNPLHSPSADRLFDEASSKKYFGNSTGQRLTKSCDNIVGHHIYQTVCPARANRSIDDVLPFRRRTDPFKPPEGMAQARAIKDVQRERAKLSGQSHNGTYHQYQELKLQQQQRPTIAQSSNSEHFSTIAQPPTSEYYSPASSSFTEYNRSHLWGKGHDPAMCTPYSSDPFLYAVPPEHENKVRNILHDYMDSAQDLLVVAILVIQIHTPEIKGCVITILSMSNPVEYGPRGQKPRVKTTSSHMNGSLHTGKSILIPEIHDPRAFVRCLLRRGLIVVSAIQPTWGRTAPIIVNEATLFAKQNVNKPTMARGASKRDVLAWCGWNMLINPAGNCYDYREQSDWESDWEPYLKNPSEKNAIDYRYRGDWEAHLKDRSENAGRTLQARKPEDRQWNDDDREWHRPENEDHMDKTDHQLEPPKCWIPEHEWRLQLTEDDSTSAAEQPYKVNVGPALPTSNVLKIQGHGLIEIRVGSRNVPKSVMLTAAPSGPSERSGEGE